MKIMHGFNLRCYNYKFIILKKLDKRLAEK